MDESRCREIIAALPYERIEAAGADAVATWARLKRESRGVPVIVGDDEELCRIGEQLGIVPRRSLESVLAAAGRLRHPEDLAAHWTQRKAETEALARSLNLQPPIRTDPGSDHWLAKYLRDFVPSAPPATRPAAPDVVLDGGTGTYLPKVHLLVLPTEDWTTVPADLRWGGWNGCPPDAYHVAALRSWRDRYGAELVGIGHDRIDLRIAAPPQTMSDALALAEEQRLYCCDLVDQGFGTVETLAEALLGGPWWHFWWD
jgi:hypothetical protein